MDHGKPEPDDAAQNPPHFKQIGKKRINQAVVRSGGPFLFQSLARIPAIPRNGFQRPVFLVSTIRSSEGRQMLKVRFS
jgi:hypothetical protein